MSYNLGISLDSYASGNLDNLPLFDNAMTTQEDITNLSKALEATEFSGNSQMNLTTASGAPLKVESLEKNLKLITFREQDIRLWKAIEKIPAYNTVEEFNQLTDYGADSGGFYQEGELPDEEDSIYVRKSSLVKFMGVTKAVTHPMQLVRTNIGSIMQQEIKNGTMWILRKVNRAITYGDSSIVTEEFDGLFRQQFLDNAFAGSLSNYMASENVIDMRNGWLTQSQIEDGGQAILDNYGYASTIYAPPRVLGNFSKDYYARQRIMLNGTGAGNQFINGNSVPKVVTTTVGDITLSHDLFMRKQPSRLTTDSAQSPLAPATPTIGSPATNVVADGSALFNDGISAGNYYYAVAAVNRYGESALLSLTSSAISVASGDAVDLKFSSGGGANPATGYTIYRSMVNPTTAYNVTPMWAIYRVQLTDLANGYDGAAAGAIRDRNRWLPNTDQCFLIQDDSECYAFKQLAPLMKMDLAVISPASRFMVLLYGTPQLYAPRKMVRYINIGPYVAA